MGRDELEVLKGGVVKRKIRRRMGLFIDATGLDRATRRLERKVDLSRLVKGLSAGIQLEVARYYCLIPYEDDARQFSFLDAVERAGVEVITKRLPPKGVKRQVSMDVHIAADLLAYGYGAFSNSTANEKQSRVNESSESDSAEGKRIAVAGGSGKQTKRVATIVCPSRELSYALYTAHEAGTDIALADFGLYGTSDGWRGVDRWIDLSTSETIWRG